MLEHGLRARQQSAGRVALTVEHRIGLDNDIRELVRRESWCWGLFAFNVTSNEDDLPLEVTAPPDKITHLDALYRATELPRRTGPKVTLLTTAEDGGGSSP